jgi:DNA-binding Xre family transcriptional regulator
VGRAVEEYQTKHGLTLERTAANLGIDRKTLFKARKGHPIRRDQIAQIAARLSTTIEDLLRA